VSSEKCLAIRKNAGEDGHRQLSLATALRLITAVADLARRLAALPEAVRAGIVAMVKAAKEAR